MRVNTDMKVLDALKINQHMIDAFIWLAPEFERLQNPVMLKTMAGRLSVGQAARMARVPLMEALYLLNLTAGEDESTLTDELRSMNQCNCRHSPGNCETRPDELIGLGDDDPRVFFVDVLPQTEDCIDPRPAIMHGLSDLRESGDVLLVRHRFDPVPLRDLFMKRGFASWAEERRPQEWYIYFYRPSAHPKAEVCPPMSVGSFFHAASAGA